MKRYALGWSAATVCILIASWAWGQAELPHGFKGMIPVYPGAKILMGMDSADGSHAVLETGDAPKAVIDHYRKAMEGKGWSVQTETTHGTGAMVHLTKGDQFLQVAVDRSGQKTTVALTLTKK